MIIRDKEYGKFDVFLADGGMLDIVGEFKELVNNLGGE